MLFALALSAAMLFGSAAHARHVTVWYVDADRPPEYAVDDVLAGIQRAMREWEAHNAGHALVLHWGGQRPLAGAPEDFDNVVIRWANTDYSGPILGVSCTYAAGCAGSPPTPTNHIFLMSFWDNPLSATGRWNNPRFVPFSGTFNGMANQDMTATLVHELTHLFRDIAVGRSL